MLPVPPQIDLAVLKIFLTCKYFQSWQSFRRFKFFTALYVIGIRGDISTVGFPVVIQYFFIVSCYRISHRKSLASIKSLAVVRSGTNIGLSNFNWSRSDWSNLNGSSLFSTAPSWVSRKIPAHKKHFWIVFLLALSHVKTLILDTFLLASK